MNKKIIVVDSNCLCWRSFFTVGHLSSGDGKPTGIIFGFLHQIFDIANKYRTNQFVFCFDSKHNFRKEIYPKYKQKRKKNKLISYQDIQSVNSQINHLRTKILKKLGFKNIYHQEGFESDDIMHEYVKSLKSEESKISQNIIVTTDGDMYQSLKYCNIYNPAKKKLLTKEWFKEEYNIDSDDWGTVKALAGCTTDEVEGIKGVGEIKAIKFLNGELVKGKIYNRLINKKSKKIFNRNLRLVKLPFIHEEESINIEAYKKENLKASRFVRVFDDLDFRSFLYKNQFEQWKKLFELQDEYDDKLERS